MASNTVDLARTILALNEAMLILTFKLNLLRSDASPSPIHLATVNGLEKRLVDVGSQIWQLEVEKEMIDIGSDLVKEQADQSKTVRDTLKKAMELVRTLDTLGGEIMRLKIAVEDVQKFQEVMDMQRVLLEKMLPSADNEQSNGAGNEAGLGGDQKMTELRTAWVGCGGVAAGFLHAAKAAMEGKEAFGKIMAEERALLQKVLSCNNICRSKSTPNALKLGGEKNAVEVVTEAGGRVAGRTKNTPEGTATTSADNHTAASSPSNSWNPSTATFHESGLLKVKIRIVAEVSSALEYMARQ